jgi:hypothetical protein
LRQIVIFSLFRDKKMIDLVIFSSFLLVTLPTLTGTHLVGTIYSTMVGIARFAKKAGNCLGNNSATGTNQLGNPTTTNNGSDVLPRSPSKDAVDMNVFGGGGYGSDFQDDGGNGCGDDISSMNHLGGYRDEYDFGGLDTFHREGASFADDGSFFGGAFSSDGIEALGMAYSVDMASDTATMGDNRTQDESYKLATTSEGVSRCATAKDGAKTQGQNNNSGRLSVVLQESSGMPTTSNSKSATTMNKSSTVQATTDLFRFSKGPSTLAEATLQDQAIVISDHPTGYHQRHQVSQGQAGALENSRRVSMRNSKISTMSIGGYSREGSREESQSVTVRKDDSHFHKILPLPPRATPEKGADGVNGQVHLQRQNVNDHEAAFQRPTNNSEKRANIAANQVRAAVDHPEAARFGMDRTHDANFHMDTPAKTPRDNHQRIVTRPHGFPSRTMTVSPYPITQTTITDATEMVALEHSRRLSSGFSPSTHPTIDMEYENNHRPTASHNTDARRVSLETEHKPVTRNEVSMQQDHDDGQTSTTVQVHQRQDEGCFQATPRKSLDHDPRRISMETPGSEFCCDSTMDFAHQGNERQPAMKNNSAFNREVEQTHDDWNTSVDMGQRMQVMAAEEMIDPSLCSLETQSQAFLESHEKTNDLQSEICADLHKMSIRFFLDYPELLQQCDELLELLGNCEDLELETDEAMSRFERVNWTKIAVVEGEEGAVAMEMEPSEPVIPETAPTAASNTEKGFFISESQLE